MLYLILSLLFLLCPYHVNAKFDPLSVPNNKYGIHIADPNDISEASELVNSSGGDWGYITLVIQQNDRNHDKWQRIFDQMRRLHLIPIVRLATEPVSDYWKKPELNDKDNWVRFLNSLNWPVENRYVVLFNEPNHANEWGKSINPEEYATIFVEFAKALQHVSEDFFILPAGLDVSAQTNSASLDAKRYIERMITAQPGIFDIMDGWTSHSYPNPGFSGNPTDMGRGTLRSFLWEKQLLEALGLKKILPIFITETGWIHNQGQRYEKSLLSPEQVAQHIIVGNNAWQDASIVAITPFIFNYQGYPFDHFSWKKLGSNDYYPQYFAYKNLLKIKGQPMQRQSYAFENQVLPHSLVSGSNELISFTIENKGQGIVSFADNYRFVFTSQSGIRVEPIDYAPIEPGEKRQIILYIEVPQIQGAYDYEFSLKQNDKDLIKENETIAIIPPPKARIRAQLGFKQHANAKGISVLVYDDHSLLEVYHDRVMIDGSVSIDGLRNVIPGKTYRIVLLVPNYLPRQAVVEINKDSTNVTMRPMYPLDFDNDGALTIRDLWKLPTLSSKFLLSLLF